MKELKTWKSEWFYGTKISEYGLKNGYVDYRTLASAFQAVLNNEIMGKTWDIGCWEQESGFVSYWDEMKELEEQIEQTEDEEQIEKLREQLEQFEEWEEEANNPEIFQFYIVDDNGAEILKEFNEIVYYNSELDVYLWGVTHWGTSWDYVLTDIKIDLDEE